MDWEIAQNKILNKITKGTSLDNKSMFRKVIEIHQPKTSPLNYDDYIFKVNVGKNKNCNISISMLKKLYLASRKNRNIYNRDVFKLHYPTIAKNTGCYIHVIGKIFEISSICTKKENNYFIQSI